MKSACRKALLLLTLPLALTACVQNSTEIGKDLIDKSLLYDTYTVEFPIEDIRLRRAAGPTTCRVSPTPASPSAPSGTRPSA